MKIPKILDEKLDFKPIKQLYEPLMNIVIGK